MVIEGLHNQTGQWLSLAEADVDIETAEVQQEAILEIDGIVGQITLWSTRVNIAHFSAFRVQC